MSNPYWLPPDHPNYKEQVDQIKYLMDRDLRAKELIKKAWEQTVLLHRTECLNGTGLIMSRTLRLFLHECFNRIASAGAHSMSMQFNVFEAFFEYDAPRVKFKLRTEIEHLLSINDFFDWYTSEDLPEKNPLILNNVMREGVIYSFNMTNDSGFFISAPDCNFVIGGVSLIRHGNELSCIVVAGENPPKVSDKELFSVKERTFRKFTLHRSY